MIGGKESDHRISSQSCDAQQAANHRGGCALVPRLNDQLMRLGVRELAFIKPLMAFHQNKSGSFGVDGASQPVARLGEQGLAAVDMAKLLRTVFAGDKLRQGS